ncbi:MAG TPA: phage/plasmid primase, P4 family [Sedimentisphaerales bacterium]|nr:phage/plasmid primase, P4 family [Sedimentisphaerales bacterium]
MNERVKKNVTEFCTCAFEPEDIVEVRLLPSGKSVWFSAQDLAGQIEYLIAENQAGQNIYIGANPRKIRGGTSAEDVALAHCLFVDFDQGATGESIKGLLGDSGFPEPTLMLSSGHGCHCYWRLVDPINDLEKWTQYQKRLIATLGSDKSIHDPPRIMRLPGFMNHKAPVADAKINFAENSRRYDIQDLEEHLVALPSEPVPVSKPTLPVPEDDKLKRAVAYIDKVENCAEGEGRNNIARRIGAVLLNDFGLSFETAWPFVQQWNTANIPPLEETELKEAFLNGEKYAKYPPGNKLVDSRPKTKPSRNEQEPGIEMPPDESCSDDNIRAVEMSEDDFFESGLTDAGNARRLSKHFGHLLRYCWDTKGWLYYDGRRWNEKRGDECAHRCAKKIRKQIQTEAIKIVDSDKRKKFLKWGFSTDNEVRQKAMLSSARSEDKIADYADKYDADAYLFNCPNVVINLKDMTTAEHSSEFLITRLGGCEYHKDADCPTWKRCVSEWMDGDDNKIDYLQRTLGMCLTGDISARAFPIFHGQGMNGKSLCLDTIKQILGDYAIVGSEDLLGEKKMPQHPCDIADLKGRRLVVVDETKKNMKLRASLVKRMTGDRELKGRLMRQNFSEFKTTHKTILMTQNLPVITETADAIWDRVHLLKWSRRFEPGEADPKLMEKFKPEYPGILNWLLAGCRKWQADGYLLKKPAAVEAATAQYREDSDPLADFLEVKCVLGPGQLVSVAEMWNAFQEWPGIEGKFKPGKRNFNNYLEERGAWRKDKREDKKVHSYWHNIGLRGFEM